MRIIIAGDGDTGTHLAQTLSVENQDIVLIGSDRNHLAELDSSSNFITFEGSPVSVSNLSQCGIESAELFVAVTRDENINLIAAQMAKGCGVKRCVARIDNPEFMDPKASVILKSTGIDSVIYPELLVAQEIKQFIENNWVNEWFGLHHGELIVAGVRVRENSPISHRLLRDTSSNPRLFHVSAIRRGAKMIIPRGDTEILPDDVVYFSVLPENLEKLRALCGRKQIRVKQIMITGAGRVTENLLSLIGHNYNITIIDPDKERCRVIASRFPKVSIVNAAANDVATLKAEGIDSCDMFLALTGSSETNIVSCMVAREHGVQKTLARIEELQYIPEAESLSIDKIINKKLINVGKILNLLIDLDTASAQCMSLDQAEIIELTAREGAKIVSRPICDLSLPKEITIGGLIRDRKGLLVEGRTQIIPGDHVMIFCVSGSLSKVERLFK
ncbi:MAG: Trk system potassium transporter TrkA [Muribaculaceae bacterium]|nr:Trk system potassium transporter TrkA [Muribaculaceae bacterium]